MSASTTPLRALERVFSKPSTSSSRTARKQSVAVSCKKLDGGSLRGIDNGTHRSFNDDDKSSVKHHHLGKKKRREFFLLSSLSLAMLRTMNDDANTFARASEEKESSEDDARIGGNPSASLQPLETYKKRLKRVEHELSAIVSSLGDDVDENEVSEDEFDLRQFSGIVSKSELESIRKALHENELGNFWEIALGANKYLNSGIKSDFARGEEDLWKLAPKKSEAISNFLTPDFNNADDKLCLIYSCVNDPSAPPSIDVLYALKLFDEGLREASKKKTVTRDGLREVAKDALDKLQTYEKLVEREAVETPSSAREAWKNPAFGKGWHGTGI
jgi:hypothetical protein